MRVQAVLTAGLFALALQGCGAGGTSNGTASEPSAGGQKVAVQAAAPEAAQGASAQGAAAPAAKQKAGAKQSAPVAPRDAAFVASEKPGRAPAVILVGDQGLLGPEADALSKAGVASLVVPAASTDAEMVGSFEALRARPNVDRGRIAVVARGPAAAAAARLLAKEPMMRGGILLDADQNAVAPLGRVRGPMVLFQNTGAADHTVSTKLVSAAPPGTIVQNYKELDGPAREERARWLLANLR